MASPVGAPAGGDGDGNPGPSRPAVSVVIPTRNRPEFLRDALAGIRGGALQDFEVIVVDQSDGDATERVVAEFDARMRYMRIQRRGACPARNAGAAVARAEIISFTDDDCVPGPDWLGRIVREFAADPALEFIFGQLRAPETRLDGGYPEALFALDSGLDRAPRKIVTMGAGANMSCRRSFLYRAGGFDDVLGRHDPRVMNADVSMAYKAFRQARWKASGEIEVVHKHGFRPHEELGPLYRSYAFELGANYGRCTRRRDVTAARLFALEVMAALRPVVRSAIRGRRPHGVRIVVAYVHGFALGLRVAANEGYIDGAAMGELEQRFAREAGSAPSA